MRLGLSQSLRRPALTVALPIILIGLGGSIVALSNRSADPLFVYRQQHLSAVQPTALAHVLSLARNPLPGLRRPRAIAAICSAQGSGELRNPWSCLVRYARGTPVRYRVTISPAGSVVASDPTGELVIHGCCVGPGRASH